MRAWNNSGYSEYSETAEFTTLAILVPSNIRVDQQSVPCSVTLRWDGSATKFYLDVATKNDFSAESIVSSYNNKDVGNTSSILLSDLLPNTDYYFRVRRLETCGLSESSSVGSFKTIMVPVPKADNGYVTCNSWMAQWQNASVVGYLLDVSNYSDFSSFIIKDLEVGNVISHDLKGLALANGGTYYYRLRSKSACGISDYSNVISFTLIGDGSSTPGTITGGATAVCVGSTTPAFVKDPNSWPSTGTWSIFNQTGTATISASGVVTGVSPGKVKVVFSTANGNCISSSTRELVVQGGSVGIASSSPTVCVNTPLISITHTTSGITGINTVSGLPSGVTAIFLNNVVTISGTPKVSGTFNYNISLIAGCGTSPRATGTITVNPDVSAGTVSFNNNSICVGATTTAASSGAARGAWSTSDPLVATVTSMGVITGISSGTASIIYTVNSPCGAPITASSTIVVNTVLPVSITTTVSPSNIICAGTAVTFKATSVNGGNNPKYEWKVNGINAGTDSSTFMSTNLVNGDKVTVQLTSNANLCSAIPVTSNETIILTKTTSFTEEQGWSIPPAANISAEILANYSSQEHGGDLNMCSLVVKNSAIVTINKGDSFIIYNNVKVEEDSGLTIESDANIIQINDDAVNSGNISVHRTSPMTKNNYTYWSSPVSGRILKDFSPLTATARFYEYVENTNLFKTVDRTTSFVPGKGYAIMAPNNYVLGTTLSFDGVFVGVPTNGTQNADNSKLQFPLVLTPNVENRGYNMIG